MWLTIFNIYLLCNDDQISFIKAYSDNAHAVTASPATTLDGSGSCLL